MHSSLEINPSRQTTQTLSKQDLEAHLKQLYTKHGVDADNLEIAQTLFDLGTVENDVDIAIDYLSTALFMYRTIYSEDGIEIHPNIAQTLYRLGEIRLVKKDYTHARNSCEQAFAMYQAFNNDEPIYLDTIAQILEMLHTICSAQEDFRAASEYASQSTTTLRRLIIHTPTTTTAEVTEEEDHTATAQVVSAPRAGQSSSSSLATTFDSSARRTPPRASPCCFGLFNSCFGKPDSNTNNQQPDVIASPIRNIVNNPMNRSS